jgi:ceramide glucosyltransferase
LPELSLISELLLGLAVVGTVTSTIFLFLTLAGALRFFREARAARRHEGRIQKFSAVTLLKPVHGLEAQLRENIESFFNQDYPEFEIIFGADTADDAALAVVREVSARYPKVPCRIVVSDGPDAFANRTAYCFYRTAEFAQHEILVTSDSDVEVTPDYLRAVVAPFVDTDVAMLTCVYRGKNAAGFWSGLTAIGMSVEMTAGVLVANMLEGGVKFGLGPTIVVKKDALEHIGGFKALGEYMSNDFVLGNRIAEAGYKTVLSEYAVSHVVNQANFRKMWDNQLRWAKSTRYSRPAGHLGSGLIFAVPYGLLGLFAGLALGKPVLGIALFVASLVNRVLESWLVGWLVVRDPVALKQFWLYPLRDLLGFAIWVMSYGTSPAVWRNSRYEYKGEKIVLRRDASAGD